MGARPTRSMSFPCGIYAPGRKLAQLCMTLKNVPGALASVTGLLALLKVNILSGHIAAFPGRAEGRVSFFIDLSSSHVSLDEIVGRLRGLDVVIDLEAHRPEFPGLIVDTAHFPLKFMGQEALIIDIRHVGEMFGRLDEVFESGAYVILFEMGHRVGRKFVKEVRERFDVDKLRALQVLGSFAVARGWCVPELVEWDEQKPRLVVRMHDLFTCKPFAGQRKAPTGHLMRGVLAGIVEELTGASVKVKETKCVAKGDPYCEFVVERAEAWAR